MPDPFLESGRFVDFSPRVAHSETVVASPAAASETTIATITLPSGLTLATGVFLFGWAAFTVGTNGVSANLKIRQTDTSGSTKAASGATTVVAANLGALTAIGFDAAPTAAGVYVLTLTVGSGSASSAVSAVELFALAI